MGLPFDWQTTKQKVSQRGQYLLESGQWSDCKFIVGQEPQQEILEGHKLFLAMASPVFEAMFFGSMAEKNDPIPIRDVQPEAFKTLLQYIYTDRIDLESFEVACELCYCAKKYMLPYLVEECTKYLWSDLSPKRVCRAYEFAKLFEEPVLLEKCLSIMCAKTNEILKESSWDDVEISTISMLFDQDNLLIDTEIDLFEALLRWSKAECVRKSLSPNDTKSLRSVTGNLIEKIRFLTLTPKQFADGPGKSQLLTRDETFAILMNVSSTVSNINMPDGFSTDMHGRRPAKLKSKEPLFLLSPLDMNFQSHYQRHPNDWNWSSETLLTPTLSQNQPPMVGLFCGVDESVSYAAAAARRESMMNNRHSSLAIDQPPIIVDETVPRDSRKYYCRRTLSQSTNCLNNSVLDCSVTFKVDKNICVIGVQVPTQIAHPTIGRSTSSYNEILYAHLLDCDGSRLTYTHFTTSASFDSSVEIGFNRPVYIQKNKIYRVGVVFNKAGRYPIGDCSKEASCDGVNFAFGVGRSAESVRAGLIRSIVFTYH